MGKLIIWFNNNNLTYYSKYYGICPREYVLGFRNSYDHYVMTIFIFSNNKLYTEEQYEEEFKKEFEKFRKKKSKFSKIKKIISILKEK